MSTDTYPISHESAIIERLMVTPESAQAVLSIQFSNEDHRRMHELRERNNEGVISPQEKAEMEAYAHLGTFLGILHSKARQALKRHSDPTGAT